MSVSLKADIGGTIGSLQLNGADQLLLNADGTLSGVATPSLFDSSKKLVTSEFVLRASGNMAGVIPINSVTTLNNGACGQNIAIYGSSGFVLTLPLGSTMPIGGVIRLSSSMSGGANCAVVRQGSDAISVGTNSLSGITLYGGNYVDLMWNGATWVAFGELQLQYSPLFSASLAANGYQKLPSGLIVQWGNFSVAASTTTTFNFPLAFPVGCASITASFGIPAQGAANADPLSKTQYRIQNTYAGGAQGGYWSAFGY